MATQPVTIATTPPTAAPAQPADTSPDVEQGGCGCGGCGCGAGDEA